MITRTKSGISKPKLYHVSSAIYEPTRVSEALSIPEWKLAMTKEFEALTDNGTWNLVPFSKDTNIISTKWVFRIKYCKDGTIERYKYVLWQRGFNNMPVLIIFIH